ncbi:MAG TPA: hypothetical protein VK120_02335 [Sporosarcina sp.]|nr:hypothetical protein [Sporosarcina sp.]
MDQKNRAMVFSICFSTVIILGATILMRQMYIQHEKNEQTIAQCFERLEDVDVIAIEVTKKHFAGPVQCQIK